MLLTGYTKITLITVCSGFENYFDVFFQTFWYINKVYRSLLKCSNLSMRHTQPGKRWGELRVTNPVLGGYMVTIRDARYIFQSMLVKAIILTYFSFCERNRPIKRVCTFNIPVYPHIDANI